MLTPKGRIETEVTISKLADGHYYVISGPMGEVRDLDFFRFSVADDEDVTITDHSTEVGLLAVAGPAARELLTLGTDTDLSSEAFRFQRILEFELFGHPVRALRIGFTGALGWELHVAMDHMLALYDALWEAGQAFGIANFGSHALNSLRMEKAYLTRKELTHDIGPRQAGVDRWVKMEKGDFVGKEFIDVAPTGADWRLAYLEVDADDADCHGSEAVFSGENAVGLTTSGGYGFTVNKSLAFAYVDATSAEPGTELQVLILGERRDAVVLAEPAWDPESKELRA